MSTFALAQDPTDLIYKTVTIPSISGEEDKVAQFLVRSMQAWGFEAQVDAAGNAVGKRGHGPKQIVLLGHIDTVPGDIPVRIQDGILHGRGSVDAKGSFCTFVSAVAALPETALEQATFICIGATEEEAPTSKGARYAVSCGAYQPDYIFIGEPSGWDAITLGYKGRLVVKVKAQKDNFHTAGEGSSAGDDLLAYCHQAQQWANQWGINRELSGAFHTIQFTIQALSSSSDGLTQTAEAVLGLRLPPQLQPQQAEAELRALAQNTSLAELPLTLEFVGHEVPYKGEKDTKQTRALRLAIRQAGGNPRFKFKTGTSDMNVVAPHWPAPMLAYGPGDSSLDHTPTEHLHISEYLQAVEVLTDTLQRLAQP